MSILLEMLIVCAICFSILFFNYVYRRIEISMFALRGASISWWTEALSVLRSLLISSYFFRRLYEVMSVKFRSWHFFSLNVMFILFTMIVRSLSSLLLLPSTAIESRCMEYDSTASVFEPILALFSTTSLRVSSLPKAPLTDLGVPSSKFANLGCLSKSKAYSSFFAPVLASRTSNPKSSMLLLLQN